MKVKREQSICEWADVKPQEPESGTNLVIALDSIGKEPINGLRQNPETGANGWFIWCGDTMPEKEESFVPLEVEQIAEYLPQVEEYLALPPGYRFLIDNNDYEDVWFEEGLINA